MVRHRLIVAGLLGATASPVLAGTLDHVRQAGHLACGVVSEPEDWTKADLHGGLAPLGLEICKAVSVAVLGDQAKLEVTIYKSEHEAGTGLKAGAVDVVLGMTPSYSVSWFYQIAFGPPVFYDGQGVMIRRDVPAKSLEDLAGMRVCYIMGTQNEDVLLARTAEKGIKILPLPFQEEGEMDDGLAVRHCDAISAYLSKLALVRRHYSNQIGKDTIMPLMLTVAPDAPGTRQDDAQWTRIVAATVDALVQAEISGVTQANVGTFGETEDPAIKRLIGTDWSTSRALGLADHDWAAKIIAAVGNYGEIYDRTVGEHGQLHLPRGQNAPWTEGGLMTPILFQ